MKEKLADFFETELHYIEVGLKRETNAVEHGNICWYAMQRGLGASTFAQICGMTFEEAELMFEEYKQKLEEMRYALR